MSGSFRKQWAKEAYRLPPGAIARPEKVGDATLIVVGGDMRRFVCGRCRGECDFRMPSRGPHRDTPTIDYEDDPLRVPVCGQCSTLMNARDRDWDLEIRARWEHLAMAYEMGVDVMSRPTLLCVQVHTNSGRSGL